MAAEIFTDLSRATSANGTTLTGATWTFYAAGTSTPQAVYANANLSTSLGSVVTADSGGMFVPIYFNSALSYRGVLKNFDGATLRDIDPINAGVLSQLAGTRGAALIGTADGNKVQDVVWRVGRATAIAGSKMSIRWLRDNAAFPLEDDAGIWPGKVATDHGISATFNAADGQAGSPCNGLFVLANNNGSPGDVVAGLFDAVARSNNVTVFGANIIARGQAAHSNVKYVGLEVDVVPNAGDTSINSASGGFYLNVFNKPISGAAIQTGGISGGSFGNGLVLGGIASTGAGVLLEASAQANSLVNTTVGTFNGVAVTLGNGKSRGILLSGTASAHAFIYNDGSNNVRNVLGAGSWIFRNNADSASLVSISDASGQGVVNVETASGEYRVNGTKVVGPRGAAITAPTGGATVDAEARTAIGVIISRLQAHGLIA